MLSKQPTIGNGGAEGDMTSDITGLTVRMSPKATYFEMLIKNKPILGNDTDKLNLWNSVQTFSVACMLFVDSITRCIASVGMLLTPKISLLSCGCDLLLNIDELYKAQKHCNDLRVNVRSGQFLCFTCVVH